MIKTHIRYIFAFTLLISVFCFFSCTSSAEKKISRKEIFTRTSARLVNDKIQTEKKAQENAVRDYVKNLPVDQKISQLFLVNIVGCDSFIPVEHSGALEGNPGKGEYLVPGGCLFFSYNIADTPEKMLSFNKSIRDFCLKHNIVPPYLAVDQEGGNVNRLRQIAGPLPSSEKVAQNFTVEEAYSLYMLQAEQMKALGFNLNLAPVVEVKTSENAAFLGNRSFGTLSEVLTYARAAVNGYENSGIGTVLKHFPGNTNTDPHTGLPEISWNEKQLEENVMIPFLALSSINSTGILMSHARLSLKDSNTPACLSSYWVDEVLRKQFGYEGLIFSDDIFMAALQENGFPPEKACIMAIDSGVDCIMLSEKRFAPVARILLEKAGKDSSFAEKIENAVFRIINWKIKQNILELYTKDSKWLIRPVKYENDKQLMNMYSAALSENIDMYINVFSKMQAAN